MTFHPGAPRPTRKCAGAIVVFGLILLFGGSGTARAISEGLDVGSPGEVTSIDEDDGTKVQYDEAIRPCYLGWVRRSK